MRWFNRYNFPYSNFHDLNLDWIIKEMNRLIEEWEQVKAEWEQMKIDWVEFQAEMQRLWDEYQELMNAAWEAYKANLNQEWATYQTNLNNAWSAFQAAMNEWKDAVDQDIQDKFDEIDTKCAECLARVQAALDNLNNVLEEVQQQVTDYLENLPYQTIIHDTTIEWLDEHGVPITTNFLTPEEYGAVGDGVTNDNAAFNQLMRDAQSQNKPVMLAPGKTYLVDAIYLRRGVELYGNNSTIDCNNGPVKMSANSIIKDVKFENNSHIIAGTDGASNVVLDNVKCGAIQLVGNSSETNLENIIIRNVVCYNKGQAQCIIGDSDRRAINLSIDGLRLNELSSGSHLIYCIDAFIRGLNGRDETGYAPSVPNLYISTAGEVRVESVIDVNILKLGTGGTIYTADYTALS